MPVATCPPFFVLTHHFLYPFLFLSLFISLFFFSKISLFVFSPLVFLPISGPETQVSLLAAHRVPFAPFFIPARLSRRPPRAHAPQAGSHCISRTPAQIVRYCPSFQRYRQTLAISADQASLSAARALTPFGSIFGSKEIGSKSRGTILCLDCVLQSAVISVVTAVQWAAAVAVGEKASGWVHNHHHHWSRKSSNLPTVLSIPPPKLLPDLKRGQKKGAKSGRYKCGKLAGSGETSVGAPVSRVLPRGAPVGARTGTTLRCFNPPAAANSRAAPVTAKTSRGDGHWSVGDQQLAEADV